MKRWVWNQWMTERLPMSLCSLNSVCFMAAERPYPYSFPDTSVISSFSTRFPAFIWVRLVGDYRAFQSGCCVQGELKASLLKPPPTVSWLRLAASASAGSCSWWAAPGPERRLPDRWRASGGREVGQHGAVTPGNLSNESTGAAGE